MLSKRRTSFVGLLAVAVIAAGNSGCGGGSILTPPPTISILASQSTAVVQTGSTAQFSATILNDTANKGVTWTISCSVTSCGTVSPTSTASGVSTTYTAPNPPATDLTVTLTAISAADSTKSAPILIKVPAITISVSPTSGTVQVNGTADFTATVTNDDANNQVNWTVSCSTSSCGSVSQNSTPSGNSTTYTAPVTAPASNLTVTITSTSAADPTKSASATITVPSVAITVAPGSATLDAGSTAPFTATLTNDSSNKGVTWTVTCSASPCGTVSPNSTASGAATTYTAPSTPPPSDLSVTLTATSVANSLATASVTITVSAITVDLQPVSATVEATTTAQFTATVAHDPSNKGVSWTISCSVSSCGSVSATTSASGVAVTYTAPNTPPTSDLSVTLTATSQADSTISASASITVPAIRVSNVSPLSGIIPINATQDFVVTVNYDPSNAGVNWTLTQNGASCSPACGTLSAATTASATPTTYTAPASVPTNPTVTFIATSVTDTTKSTSATITITNGTVKLIPASLSFSCKIAPRNLCPPPAQTISLTQTGGAALTVNGITITGTNATLFLQTNDCGTSVAAGASCTVTVTFHPAAVGSFTAAVSFNDSSPDSPLKVALSGRAFRAQIRNEAGARSDLAATTSAAVPAPSGRETVGTTVLHMLDSSREDPYLANGAKRELAVRVWYPASLNANQGCKPAEYTSAAVWKYFSQLVGVQAFPVTTNSCLDAPVASGAHPVVLFTPGFTATFSDYTFLTEDLASRGYIVVAVAHTFETTAVELNDGRLAKSVLGSHLGGPMQADGQSLSTAVYTRLLDLKFVVNELERLNARHDNAFAGKLDLTRIAVAGHSLGGLTAFLDIELDPRVKAAIIMDGLIPTASPSGSTNKPVLLLGAGRDRWEPTECRLWNNLAGPRLAVNLRDTEHVALGDWIWLTRNAVQTGSMGPEKTMAAVRDYIAAFLDAHVRGMTPDRLLTGSSADYQDAAVVTQEQRLCANPAP
jgi:dienelactone hydrolase